MIKEYICRMQEENRKKVEEIEQDIKELSLEVESSEQQLAQIQQENGLNKTIFSPRALDSETDKKIVEKQQEIEQLKRRLDYAGQMRETELRNKREYQALADEVDQSLSKSEQQSDIGQAVPEVQNTKDDAENASIQAASVDTEELLSFLNFSCKKIEYSLSLVSGNKNRCKSELRSLLLTTRSYIQKIEDNNQRCFT